MCATDIHERLVALGKKLDEKLADKRFKARLRDPDFATARDLKKKYDIIARHLNDNALHSQEKERYFGEFKAMVDAWFCKVDFEYE